MSIIKREGGNVKERKKSGKDHTCNKVKWERRDEAIES